MRRPQAPSTCRLSGPSPALVVLFVGFADLGEQLAVDRQVAFAPNGVELLQRLLELPATGAHQLVERPVELVEAVLHLVERLVVLQPLLAELADQAEDLVARLLDHEVVEGLADDTEEREQGERRAHHDALAEGIVEQRRVVLVDEPGELLVGQEQQDVVDRGAGAGAGVVALGQLLHPQPDVAQERRAVRLAFGFGRRFEVAEVARPSGT